MPARQFNIQTSPQRVRQILADVTIIDGLYSEVDFTEQDVCPRRMRRWLLMDGPEAQRNRSSAPEGPIRAIVVAFSTVIESRG
jgi:hypothetical protein